jgi:hypothetical protein
VPRIQSVTFPQEVSGSETPGDRVVQIPFRRKLDETFRGDRSTWLKVGGGVFVALFVTFESVVRQEMVADRATMWRVTLIALLVAALSGGLIAFFLTMKDQVKRRLLRGERVNPLIRAYLGMGIWSLLLWCPTVFFLGILLIIVTH